MAVPPALSGSVLRHNLINGAPSALPGCVIAAERIRNNQLPVVNVPVCLYSVRNALPLMGSMTSVVSAAFHVGVYSATVSFQHSVREYTTPVVLATTQPPRSICPASADEARF